MQYGRFSDDGREYVIENTATPSPWINYLQNGRYFSLISANGGGISYIGNPLHGRVTRYRINDVPPDRPGKYIYVRDRDSGEIWSLFWQPVGRDLEKYTAVHGFGYTTVTAEVKEIASRVLFFVPQGANQEIWSGTLRNLSDRPRRLSLYGYVELCLGHGHVDLINQCDDQHFNRVFFDRKENALFATKTYWVTQHSGTQQQENQAWDQWAFFTVNRPVLQYETLRERFIGPFRNEEKPLALEAGELSCQGTDFGNAVGVLRTDIDLEPGAAEDVIFSLGVIPKTSFDEEKSAAVAKYRQRDDVERDFARMKEEWDRRFQGSVVRTPERDVDAFLNYWNPYQARVAFDVGRVASFYYWGISRGFGFRDTAQDTMTVTPTDPEKAQERIALLSRQMYSTGKVLHHFTADGQGESTGHCDDPFWFILAVTEYIKETGDLAILEQEEPFLDGKSGTICDHLMAVASLAGRELGEHGLPIFGRGDWNDTLDYIGGDDGGESVWGALFYLAMLNALIELLEFAGRGALVSDLVPLRENLSAAVNGHCWDGKWFIRAFGAGGRKVGSRECRAGKIFLNSQSWAVIARVAGKERLIEAMDSARELLDTPFGPKICAPAYREIDPSIGLVTRCVAGKKENGAVFCHPVTWAIMAECLLGRGNRAYDYYRKTLPNQVDPDTFCAEPYVYSQYITSDEHTEPGKASHSWQTGTAAWMAKAAIGYMLGVRASYRGLEIDPAIPSHWRGYRVERTFRGTRYLIDVENPDQKENGVASIEVDGEAIEGQVIPLQDKGECRVRILMG